MSTFSYESLNKSEASQNSMQLNEDKTQLDSSALNIRQQYTLTYLKNKRARGTPLGDKDVVRDSHRQLGVILPHKTRTTVGEDLYST